VHYSHFLRLFKGFLRRNTRRQKIQRKLQLRPRPVILRVYDIQFGSSGLLRLCLFGSQCVPSHQQPLFLLPYWHIRQKEIIVVRGAKRLLYWRRGEITIFPINRKGESKIGRPYSVNTQWCHKISF